MEQRVTLELAGSLGLILWLLAGGSALAQPFSSLPMTAERYNDRWTLWGIPLAGEFIDSRTIARYRVSSLRCTTWIYGFGESSNSDDRRDEGYWPKSDIQHVWRMIEARFDTAGRIVEKIVLRNTGRTVRNPERPDYDYPIWDTTRHYFNYYFDNNARLVRHDETVAAPSGVSAERVEYTYGTHGELRLIDRWWQSRKQGSIEFVYDSRGRLSSIIDDYRVPYIDCTLTTHLDSNQKRLSTELIQSWSRFLFWSVTDRVTRSDYRYDTGERLRSVVTQGDPLPIYGLPFVDIACYSYTPDDRQATAESFEKSERGSVSPSCITLDTTRGYRSVNTAKTDLNDRGLPSRAYQQGMSVHGSNGLPVFYYDPMIDSFEYEYYRD